MDKPEWWDWSFECENTHVRDRMVARQFNEADVREMIETAFDIQPGEIATRYYLFVRYAGAIWKIVVEPDPLLRVVVVVTAFTIERLP